MRAQARRASAYEIQHWDAGPNANVVVAAGEIDRNAALALGEALGALAALGRTHLVLDLSGATFIDSTAIGELAGYLRRTRARGGALTLICTNPNVLRTLEVAGMSRILEICPTLADVAPVKQLASIRREPARWPAQGVRQRVELRVAPDAAELARVRAFAAAAARRCGLPPNERHDLALAASEAAANAIEHGRPCDDNTIQLWLSERQDALAIGVRDAGTFHLKPLPNDPLRERGRGLELMSALVDEVVLRRRNGHTEIELTKYR
jgi:anti-sigma B factor antagonist